MYHHFHSCFDVADSARQGEGGYLMVGGEEGIADNVADVGLGSRLLMKLDWGYFERMA